ncbi:hypothetical protein IWX49DRAFT_52935 [Phyllosticta citricarpa]|uniref:Uncharacterized protein n=2 Tax=Phyllosticta TaxID=121621 RepID=A0ABR1MT19_9PEZI
MPPRSPLSDDPSTTSPRIQQRVRSLLENGDSESIYALPPPISSSASSTHTRSRLLCKWNPFQRTRRTAISKTRATHESGPRSSADSNGSAWPIVPHQPAVLQQRDGNSPRIPPTARVGRRLSIEHVDLEAPPMPSGAQKEARQSPRKTRKTRRRNKKKRCCGIRISPRRQKVALIICSGIFLIAVASLYLSIGLTRPVPRELHIVFILLIMAATIVFSHSSIRLCMLTRRLHSSSSRRHIRNIPEPADPPSFNPSTPIRVHLARDEDFAADVTTAAGPSAPGRLSTERSFSPPLARQTYSAPATPRPSVSPALSIPPPNFSRPYPRPPPPSYGVWRTSVPLNPNLLHWQRVSSPPPLPNSLAISLPVSASSTPHIGSLPHEQGYLQSQPLQKQGQFGRLWGNESSVERGFGRMSAHSSRTASRSPGDWRRQQREAEPSRPPSYVTDDGISYIFEISPSPRPWPRPQFNHVSPPPGFRPYHGSPSPRPHPHPYPAFPRPHQKENLQSLRQQLFHSQQHPPLQLQRSASVGTGLGMRNNMFVHPAERKWYGGVGRVGDAGRYPLFSERENSPGEWIAQRMRISGLKPEDVHPAYR